MLVVDDAQLVVLEMPKTATQALRRALETHVREVDNLRRHGGFRYFKRNLYDSLAQEWNGHVECCCVVREPLARIQSWYRYRQRPKIAGSEKSTAGIEFEDYVEALLSPAPPPYAEIGRQAQFVGWNGSKARVDHVFDYQRLYLLLGFLSERIGTEIKLPLRNQSTAPMPSPLRPQLQARFADAYAEDYALYHLVQKAGGHLQRGFNKKSRRRKRVRSAS
jgi:hypothetical protein